MQGYKGFAEINRQATQRLKEMGLDKEDQSMHAVHQPVKTGLLSPVREIPRKDIVVWPELFQGRETAYAEETVEKIMREGFDKSREPIVVWQSPELKYIVISGHSRWEASERLYKAGDTSLATMPVKVFLGDLDDATDYALLESNRDVTQEGLKSDLKAYKRAVHRGYNREHLKGLFKPESRLRLLEDISHLNEHGSFLSYLGTESEKSLPYLQRNAQWVGLIRKEIPDLSDGHEEEMFKYLYGIGEDNRNAGKKKITISKEQFFDLINSKVSRIDFDPQYALNLDDHVSTSALTDPAKQEIENIHIDINNLIKERDKKDELIARATTEGKIDLVEKFRQRQVDINRLITTRLLEIQKIEQQIGQIERTALDLFATPNNMEDTKQHPASEADSNAYTETDRKPETENQFEELPIWQTPLKDYLASITDQQNRETTTYDREKHRQQVALALKKSEHIPENVLADYPDLLAYTKPQSLPQQENEETESVQKEKTDDNNGDSTFLLNDNWFKAHPEKILGTVEHTRNKFNREVTVVKGSLEEALQAIQIPEHSETPEAHILQSEIKEPLEQLLDDPAQVANLDGVIADSLQQHADKTLNHLKGNKDKYADGCPEEYYCFDDIVATYNKGISSDEIKAWIWYKRRSGGLNDETTILRKTNGWSKYVVPLKDVDALLETWVNDGIICYLRGDYIPSVLYYAENIYERLKTLEDEKRDLINRLGQEQYERQLKGLEDIKPRRLTLTDPKLNGRLFIKPDSAFASETHIQQLANGTEVHSQTSDDSINLLDGFKDWLNALPKNEFKKTTNLNIINYYLDRKNPPRYFDEEERLRMKENAKKEGDALFVRFLAEALLPSDRERIEERWNRIYNGYVEINYLKVPVGFTCSSTFKNKPLFIRRAQREGIGFMSAHGSGCVAYDVGVGKTMTAILSIAQAMEMGQCKRPFIVVPNATYSNWLAELRGKTEYGKIVLTGILPQYPINDLYNLSEEHLSLVLNDERKVQPVAEGSITLLTYEGFNRLCFKEATWNRLGDELFEILNQGWDSLRDEEQLKEKIKELMGLGSRGGLVDIEDLGLDYFTVDEAHAMKKSFTSVKGEIKDTNRQKATYGIHSGEPSMIALRGFMVSQYILRNNNMRNVQLLTATPFTNSPLEIYSILALIAYQQLILWGIRNLKDFFDTFIKTSTELTINAKLQPERKEVVLGFNNLIALQQLIFKFITYKTGEDAMIQRPNKIVLPLLNHMVQGNLVPLPPEEQISTNLPMTTEQKQIMSRIERFITGVGSLGELCNSAGMTDEPAARKSILLNESKLTDEDKQTARVLKGLTYARQVALSPYLFSCNAHKTPTYRQYIETSPKLLYVMGCIRSVKAYHERHGQEVSGQVIYMNAGIQYFPLIKDYLVNMVGFKDSEIGIISSGISLTKKEGIKEGFQAGSVKVIIGSATIKEGINLQNRSSVLYNCWLDWNPTDVKQLEGRIWRFGNMFANVRIVYPLAEDSIDTFTFQKLEEKTSRINEIWYRAGKENALDLEDLNPAELKMGLVTNPKILAELMLINEKEEIEDEIARLNNERGIIESIHTSRVIFEKQLPQVRKIADRYKPPRDASSQRAPSTLLKILYEYIHDDKVKATVTEKDLYWKASDEYNWLQRGLEETLEPRGLDLNFNEAKIIQRIDDDVTALKTKKEKQVGPAAVAAKEAEIVKERKRKGYQRKSVEQRIEEFVKMNSPLLSDLMVYDDAPETKEKIVRQIEHGRDLEASADAVDEMENLTSDLSEMERILSEMEANLDN